METVKHILEWDTEVLEKKMKELGFRVEFIEKPETLERICSKRYKDLDDIAYLSEESREKIQTYLNEKKADGCLVINKQVQRREKENDYCGNITLIAYVLKPLDPIQS